LEVSCCPWQAYSNWTQFGTQGGVYITVDPVTQSPWLITNDGRVLKWGRTRFALKPYWIDETASGLPANPFAIAVWNDEPWVIVGGRSDGGPVYKRGAYGGKWTQQGSLFNATSIARDTSSGYVYIITYGGPDDDGTFNWHNQNNVYE